MFSLIQVFGIVGGVGDTMGWMLWERREFDRVELTYNTLGVVHPVPLLKTQHVDI